jgi:hypothetical protein
MAEGSTEMVRMDKFKVGDKVTWFDDHYATLVDGRERYGNGPFTVSKVYDRENFDHTGELGTLWESMAHTQHLEIEGWFSRTNVTLPQQVSGAFFKLWEGN